MPIISHGCPSCLPNEQALVTFFVDGREEPVLGRFAGGKFHSRWADYDVGRVASWQTSVAGADPAHEHAVDAAITERLEQKSILGRISDCLHSRAADRDRVQAIDVGAVGVVARLGKSRTG